MADPGKHLRVITKEIRLPLIGLAAHEPVKILEAHARRPLVEGTGRTAVLEPWSVMVLAEPRGRVAVFLEDLADGGIIDTDDGVIAGVAGGQFADNAEAH